MTKFYRLVALTTLLVLLLAACAPVQAPAAGEAAAPTAAPAEAAAPGGAIKLGFMGPLTGGAASLGQEQLGYVKVAVELFNAQSGLNVQVVEIDTELNPDVAKTQAERLAADPEVLVVVGPAGSQECEATKPVFKEAGLAHITQSCTRTDLTSAENATGTFFRPIPVDDDQAKTDAAFMLNTLKPTAAYLVDDQSSYSTGLNDALQRELEAGGVTVERGSVTQEDTDLSSTAAAVVAAGAEVVFFSGQLANQLGTLAVQLREQGFTGQYFLADAGFDPTWFETAQDAAEGTYVSVFSPDPTTVESMKEYNDAYAATAGKPGGSFGGASAQAAYAGLAALEACKDNMNRACVVDALKNLKLETSPLGVPVAFDANGQLTGAQFFLYQVKAGKFELVAN